jgi:hypothetical protein
MLSIAQRRATPKIAACLAANVPAQVCAKKSADHDAPQREKSHTICKGTLINVIGTLGLATRYE